MGMKESEHAGFLKMSGERLDGRIWRISDAQCNRCLTEYAHHDENIEILNSN